MKHREPSLSKEPVSWQRKFDHRLQALWLRVPEAERARHSVRVLFRFNGPDESLKRLGAQVHSVSGDIASGTVLLSDLPRIASASEILFVELAQSLTHDR